MGEQYPKRGTTASDEQRAHLRRVKQKIDPFVHDWCEMRARDRIEFNGEDMYRYVHTCCEQAKPPIKTKDDSIRRAMSDMRAAGIVDYENTNKRTGTYVVTAARGLGYVRPAEPENDSDHEQLTLGGVA